MIKWHEHLLAQVFPWNYEMHGNCGDRTAQAGNAVSANVAAWVADRATAVLNRTAAAV
jgi:DNA (cytosine-5)-methyltransferase 1